MPLIDDIFNRPIWSHEQLPADKRCTIFAKLHLTIALIFSCTTAFADAPTIKEIQVTIGHGGQMEDLNSALSYVRNLSANENIAARLVFISNVNDPGVQYQWPVRLRSLEISGSASGITISGANNSTTWLDIRASYGQNTNINIHDLTIKDYLTAISIDGARERPLDGWNGGNKIHKMTFYNIGARGKTEASTAVIRLINSRMNEITDNIFIAVENANTCGLIHAVYLAHYSSSNLISGNRIYTRCMDAFRWRDQSNDNLFENNIVAGSPPTTTYSEWFCKNGCTKKLPECPSVGNQIVVAGRKMGTSENIPGIFVSDVPAGPVSPNCKAFP